MGLLSKDNPRLVYVSLPGYGEGHPKRNAAGWDAAIGAETGFFSPPDGVEGPVFSPLPMPSIFAAVLGALGVAAALLDARADPPWANASRRRCMRRCSAPSVCASSGSTGTI